MTYNFTDTSPISEKEYEKICSAAYAEYIKIDDVAWARYVKICVAAQARVECPLLPSTPTT